MADFGPLRPTAHHALDQWHGMFELPLPTNQSRGPEVYQTPDEVATIIVDCIAAEHPPIRLRTSEWASELCDLKTRVDPDGRLLQRQVVNVLLGDDF